MKNLILVAILMVAAIGNGNGELFNEHCDDKVMCTDVPIDYPSFQDNIDSIVLKNKALFADTYKPLDESESITTGDDQNCMATTTIEKPFVIKTNVSSEYVVQSKYFQQTVRVTKCKRLSAPCFGGVITPGFGISATCEEKYGTVSLYIYDEEKKKLKYKLFEVPVCCVCKIQNDASL